jgi:integrase
LQKPDPKDVYLGLRNLALGITRQKAGLPATFAPTEPWGVVMDWIISNATATIIAFSNWHASILGNFRKTWNSACVRAGLGSFLKRVNGRKKYAGFIFHSLRRTALTNMADAGVSAHAAMSISGHLSQKVFNDYLQLVERQAKEAKRKMEIYLDHRMGETKEITKSIN